MCNTAFIAHNILRIASQDTVFTGRSPLFPLDICFSKCCSRGVTEGQTDGQTDGQYHPIRPFRSKNSNGSIISLNCGNDLIPIFEVLSSDKILWSVILIWSRVLHETPYCPAYAPPHRLINDDNKQKGLSSTASSLHINNCTFEGRTPILRGVVNLN
jgi:hypothetical protein